MFLFVLLFVFVWKSDYSIWNSGAYILRDTEFILEAIIVRLAIGVAGIIFATYLFGFLYDRFKEHTLTRLFVGIGKETLSLYLLQHIIVEILLPWLVGWLALDDYLADNHLFAGYVLSPLISLLLLFLMYGIVNIIQKSEYTKWVFGFRIVISSKKPNH